MGTNYYLLVDVCKSCGRPESKLHIGKQSAGWKFLFQAYTDVWQDIVIKNFEDWKRLLTDSANIIEDEYKRRYSFQQFLDLLNATNSKRSFHGETGCYIDASGYEFYDREFS